MLLWETSVVYVIVFIKIKILLFYNIVIYLNLSKINNHKLMIIFINNKLNNNKKALFKSKIVEIKTKIIKIINLIHPIRIKI